MADRRRGARRGRGRSGLGATPDLRGTLGTLLRTTLYQVGMLKEAVERQARTGRERLDGALLDRRRRDALAALGEAVYEMAMSGELGDLEEVPEVADIIGEIEAMEARIDEIHGPDDDDDGTVSSAAWAAAPTRRRFDRDRGRPPRRAGRAAEQDDEVRVWRPVRPSAADEPTAAEEATPPPRRPRRRARPRGGGIAFAADPADSLDDDDDLEEYMHPDDVAPRGESGDSPDK